MPKIVMIHGMCVTGEFWGNFRMYFEIAGYECFVPDLPRHRLGVLDDRVAQVGLTDYVQRIVQVVKSLNEPPILMGHSMGGLVALLVAARIRVKALVLIAPATPAGIFALAPSVISCFAGIVTKPYFWKKPFRFSRQAFNRNIANGLDPDQREEMYQALVNESGRVAFEIGLWPFDRKKASAVDYEAIKAPALILAGENDRITPAWTAGQLQSKLHASLMVYRNAAHMLTLETGWQQRAGDIIMWLNKF